MMQFYSAMECQETIFEMCEEKVSTNYFEKCQESILRRNSFSLT